MSKHIIKWSNFLNEKQLDLFARTRWEKPELKYGPKDSDKFWPMSKDQIKDLLVELEDGGYFVNVKYGFIDDDQDVGPYKLKLSLNKRELTPTIFVSISPKIIRDTEPNQLSDEDLTWSLTSFYDRVKPKFKTIEIYDEDDELVLNNLRIQSGIEYEHAENDFVIIPELFINLVWFKPVYLTDKMIIEYHNLDDRLDISYNEKNEAYITYPASKYTEWLISSKDDYYDILTDKNGFESLWERYWDYSDRPSVEDLFNYHLDIKSEMLLVDLLIDDFEQIKEVDEDEYETLTGVGITTKEQLIERIKKVGSANIGNLLEKFDEDYIEELRSMWSDMGVSATVDMIQDKIVSALEQVIQDQLQTKVTKIEWKDGTPYLTMKFNLDWLERYEGQDEWMGYVISEYISQNYLDDNRLKVYVDYMEDADRTEYNRDVQVMAIARIERKGRKPITN